VYNCIFTVFGFWFFESVWNTNLCRIRVSVRVITKTRNPNHPSTYTWPVTTRSLYLRVKNKQKNRTIKFYRNFKFIVSIHVRALLDARAINKSSTRKKKKAAGCSKSVRARNITCFRVRFVVLSANFDIHLLLNQCRTVIGWAIRRVCFGRSVFTQHNSNASCVPRHI